jgi:hypothetical protein
MTAFLTLITPIPFDEGIFFVITFRTPETVGPLYLKKMFSAIFLCFKAIHEVYKVHLFLLHGFTLFNKLQPLLQIYDAYATR